MKHIAKVAMFSFFVGTTLLSAKVIATVNGYPITLQEADTIVKRATKGKAKYYMLKSNDRRRVIQELARRTALTHTASKELSKQEKLAVWTEYYIKKHYKELQKKAKATLSVREKYIADTDLWVRKNAFKIPVTEEEMKAEYNKHKKLFKDRRTGKIVPFEKVKGLIAVELKKKKFVNKFLKTIKINYNPKSKTQKKK